MALERCAKCSGYGWLHRVTAYDRDYKERSYSGPGAFTGLTEGWRDLGLSVPRKGTWLCPACNGRGLVVK